MLICAAAAAAAAGEVFMPCPGEFFMPCRGEVVMRCQGSLFFVVVPIFVFMECISLCCRGSNTLSSS